MKILALESSAKAASAALCQDGKLLAQSYQNAGLTHSVTLLPMAEELLKNAGLSLADVDAVAVAHGPGSFTGVRIGVSAAKGLCWGADKPAIGVSTLEAMAWNGECAPPGSLLCCAMDARRSQVYNALFTFEDGSPRRLCPDRAIGLEELAEELKGTEKPIFVLGDGAELCYNVLREHHLPVALAPESVRMQTAYGVCRAAEGRTPVPAGQLLPVYLRLSQAERERLERLKKEK
ncbi:MAG: tRNA (adenosine(37)-N6)-threonylcarbamoyltransferase complex dimerization subunit type 1 TsaB [Oscillospiraceae bacterium]